MEKQDLLWANLEKLLIKGILKQWKNWDFQNLQLHENLEIYSYNLR